MNHRRSLRSRLTEKVERSSDLRALLVLVVLLILRFYRRIANIGILYGFIFPDRRFATIDAHWIGDDRRQNPPLHPTNLLVPVVLAQVTVFVIATLLPLDWAITLGTVGNLVIVGMAMLPSVWKKRTI